MSIPDDNMSALTAFAAVGAEFCEFVESLRATRPPRMYHALESLLARLHLAILPVEEETPEKEHPEYESMRTTASEEDSLREALTAVFNTECSDLQEWYKNVDSNSESVCATDRVPGLPDDILSVYADIRRGLALWRLGTPDTQAEAAFQWRWQYEHHWADHMFRAMTTVHEARRFLHAD